MTRLKPLCGKQREAARGCVARINIFEGSVRSGKTVSSLLAWLRFVREGPPGNLLMAGKTQRTLKRNVIDPLVEWLGTSRRSEEHTSELQSRENLVCRLLLEKKK